MRAKKDRREIGEREREKETAEKRRKCGIINKKRKHRSMELSADRTEEEKNLWFLWFHQHD